MKAIDAMRTHISNLRYQGLKQVAMVDVEKCLDEIERELEERFIKLPVGADNVPIKVNDEMESVRRPKEVFVVKRLKYSEKHRWMIGGAARDDLSEYGLYAPSFCHHHKLPTVEDVLREFVFDACGDSTPEEAVVKRFAERLRLREEGE